MQGLDKQNRNAGPREQVLQVFSPWIFDRAHARKTLSTASTSCSIAYGSQDTCLKRKESFEDSKVISS